MSSSMATEDEEGLASPKWRSRQAVAAVARAMLNGEVDLAEGCRKLVELRGELHESDWNDPELDTARGVDSELDGFPFGSARSHWAPGPLAELDRRREEYIKVV